MSRARLRARQVYPRIGMVEDLLTSGVTSVNDFVALVLLAVYGLLGLHPARAF